MTSFSTCWESIVANVQGLCQQRCSLKSCGTGAVHKPTTVCGSPSRWTPSDAVVKRSGVWDGATGRKGTGRSKHAMSAWTVRLCRSAPELFAFQIPALAQAGYRVLAMDMKGYGDSSSPPGGLVFSICPVWLSVCLSLLSTPPSGPVLGQSRLSLRGSDSSSPFLQCLVSLHFGPQMFPKEIQILFLREPEGAKS